MSQFADNLASIIHISKMWAKEFYAKNKDRIFVVEDSLLEVYYFMESSTLSPLSLLSD